MATITASATGGNWSSTGAWVGGVVPGTGDSVLLTASSGSITLDASATNICNTLNCTGYINTLTLASGQTFTISGNTFTLASTMVLTLSGTIGTFLFTDANNETCAITTGGLTLPNVTIGSGLTSSSTTYQIQDSFKNGSTSSLIHTCGTLDFNSTTCSIGQFNSNNSNTRTILMEGATITISGTTSPWNITTGTNLTLTCGTSSITMTATSVNFEGGGKTYYNVTFSNGGVCSVNQGGTTYNNLTFTGTGSGDQFFFPAAQTINGTLTINGASATSRVLVSPNNLGNQQTITAANVSLSNADFQDIVGAGAASPFTGTLLGNCGNCSGITFTPAETLYWVATGGGNANATSSWSLSSGGSNGARSPLPQDAVVFDGNSITSTGKTISINVVRSPGYDFTNVTHTPSVSFPTPAMSFFGSLNLTSATITAGAVSFSMKYYGASTLTTAGNSINGGMSQTTRTTDTLTLQDNLSIPSTKSLTINEGTFNANNMNITSGTIGVGSNGFHTLNMGSGTWTCSGTGTVWSLTSSTTTVNAQTSTIAITDTSSATKTFAGNGYTYNALTITSGGTGAIILTGANTFNEISMTGGTGTLTFPSSTTTTLTQLNVGGTGAGNLTVNASTSGTQATVATSPTGVQNVSYVTFQDIKATGPGWFDSNGTNTSNNTGITFANNTIGAYASDSVTETESYTVQHYLTKGVSDSTTVTEAISIPAISYGIAVTPANMNPTTGTYFINGVKIV